MGGELDRMIGKLERGDVDIYIYIGFVVCIWVHRYVEGKVWGNVLGSLFNGNCFKVGGLDEGCFLEIEISYLLVFFLVECYGV